MQPAMIRRLLVFGVCLAGVGCLYLVPSMAGSPSRVGSTPTRIDLPTAVTLTSAATPDPGSGTNPAASLPLTPAPTGSTAVLTAGGDVGTHRGGATSTAPTRVVATAGDPTRDDRPPAAVGRLRVSELDPERLTVTWPDAGDDVVSYRVWMNGFFVMATQQTRATLAWFNDTSTHVIQVRALDAAGNEGPPSPTLLVARPSPRARPTAPAPSPTSAATPTRKPTLSPSPSPTESDEATPRTHDTSDITPSATADVHEREGTKEDGS
jgi:hypothetical protein